MSVFRQDIIFQAPQELKFHRVAASYAYIDEVLDTLDDRVLGVSCTVDAAGDVDVLALATTTHILLVHIDTTSTSRPQSRSRRLFGGEVALVGFDMPKIALRVRHSLGYDVQGVDLSTVFSKSTAFPMTPAAAVRQRLYQSDVRRVQAVWSEESLDNVGCRAWIAAWVGNEAHEELRAKHKLRTSHLSCDEVKVLLDVVNQADRLYEARPTVVENDFDGVSITNQGLAIKNARYKTRVRSSEQTQVVIRTDKGQVVGRPGHAKGRTTQLLSLQGQLVGTVQSIHVIGREEPTVAERARDEHVLLVLRNERRLQTSPFVRMVWFPALPSIRQPERRPRPLVHRPALNPSQSGVVDAIADPEIPLVVVQGPPGSGKTSTIAQAVKECARGDQRIWIAAQSNVAVKNIAEKLFKEEIKFRLLVSKEFHFEWHEHMYTQLEHVMIRTDEFPEESPAATERLFLDRNVVLCTLSMLSNPALLNAHVFKVVPVEFLIIDEASQINISDYMHLFDKFADKNCLRKVCMFGDPKQLAPYGVDQAPTIRSIFQVPHLPNPYFLDTQYRMPIPIGNFISREVYNSRLKSNHSIKERSCVRFVDVDRGQEEKIGQSWKNRSEVETIGHLMSHYYKNEDVCIITPYDPQRAAITEHLKAERLPWECVFNVDSFQGNEADYVIISVVRTASAGFLKSLERMNVMLTRCKKGMIIVTNKAFVQRDGRRTLLGSLATAWSHDTNAWTTWSAVLNGAADLPGATPLMGVKDPADAMLATGLVGLSLDEPVRAGPSLASPARLQYRAPAWRSPRQSGVTTTHHRLATLVPSLLRLPLPVEDSTPEVPVGEWRERKVSPEAQSNGWRRK